MSETSIKARIHWHDSKSGDGFVKLLPDNRLVRFHCNTVADLQQGEVVYGTLYEDTTWVQFELDTRRL